jgi:hypothetical protein
MARLIDAQFAAAEARGREMLETDPRALAARYDQAAGRVVLDLANGCGYAFPARLARDLQGASDDELARVEVDGLGFNLHWPTLDVDLHVSALVSGVFGTRAWMTRNWPGWRGVPARRRRPPRRARTAPRADAPASSQPVDEHRAPSLLGAGDGRPPLGISD